MRTESKRVLIVGVMMILASTLVATTIGGDAEVSGESYAGHPEYGTPVQETLPVGKEWTLTVQDEGNVGTLNVSLPVNDFETNGRTGVATVTGTTVKVTGLTAEMAGVYNLVIKAMQDDFEPSASYKWYKFTIVGGVEITADFASHSKERVGGWVEIELAHTGGSGAAAWSVDGSTPLPAGLSLKGNWIVGTPTEKFDGKVTVNLTVGEGTAAQSATKDWTVQVFAAIAGAGTETVRTDGTGAFASTPVENDAGLGVTWAVESVAGAATSMPDWMQLDAGTGVLSGTCLETAVASYTVALKGTSANDPSQTATRTVVVNHQPEQAITPGEGGTTIGEDEGIEGADVRIATYVGAEPKKVALSVKGATSGVVWSLPDDKPAYVSIDAATGEVTVDAGSMTDGQGVTTIVVVTAEVNGARAECGVQIVIEDTLRVAGMTVGSSPVQTSKLQTMAGMPGSIDVSITGGSGNTVVLHEKGVQGAYAGTDIGYADGRLIAESASPIQKTMTLTVTSEGGQSADCDITVSVYKRAEFTAVPTVGDASSGGSD